MEKVLTNMYKMSADMGEGGVKNSEKNADVLYGRTLRVLYPELTSYGDIIHEYCSKVGLI